MSLPVLVTGGSGFLGFHLCRALGRAGVPYRALVRPTSRTGALRGLGADLRRGDITRAETLGPALRGCGAVVHLAGAADVADAGINEAVNVAGTAHLARACLHAGIQRMVFFSSNCAARPLQDAYGRTKLLAEQALVPLQEQGLDLRILRPAMIYGEGSREFATFLRLVALLPVVPVPGSGQHLLRPVLVDDAVQAALQALAQDGLSGRIYDIVSPDSVTTNGLIALVARLLGRRRRVLHLPAGLCLKAAHLLGRLQTHPAVTPDQVLAFAQDTCGDPGPPARDLCWHPRPVEQGLSELLGRTPWWRMGQVW